MCSGWWTYPLLYIILQAIHINVTIINHTYYRLHNHNALHPTNISRMKTSEENEQQQLNRWKDGDILTQNSFV